MFSSERTGASIFSHPAQIFFRHLIPVVGTLMLAVAPSWGQGTLGRLVVVGDSLSAGFQNFSLYDSGSAVGAPLGGQKHGYAALVAQQAGANLNLPLISYPGIPSVLTIDALGNISRGSIVGGREDPTAQTLDLSVPGYSLRDALVRSINVTNVTDPVDAMALQVLGFPGLATNKPPCGSLGFWNNTLWLSELACAVELHPTTVLVSIGNNDVLGSLIYGTPPTPFAQFAFSYSILLGSLASTGAKVVVSNIPDITSVPFLVPVPAFEAVCHFVPSGATAADFLVPNITDPTKSSLNICTNYAIRTASIIAQARAAVVNYNHSIAAAAHRFGAIVVNVNGLLGQISQNGYQVGQRHLTAGFLGGIFSLDGIHPTNTGYAILANEVIKDMNSHLRTNIPLVSVEEVAESDPLVFP